MWRSGWYKTTLYSGVSTTVRKCAGGPSTQFFAISHCDGCGDGGENRTAEALGVALCRWSRQNKFIVQQNKFI